MASQKSLAIRRADAIERIKAALGKLQTLVALAEPAELEPQHKDPEIRQTLLVENFATVLEAVVVAVEPAKKSKKKADEPQGDQG